MKELYLIQRKHGKQLALVVSPWGDYTLEQSEGKWKSAAVELDAKASKWIKATYPKARVLATAVINSTETTPESVLDVIQNSIQSDGLPGVVFGYDKVHLTHVGGKWYYNGYLEERTKFWFHKHFFDLSGGQAKVYRENLIKPDWIISMDMKVVPNSHAEPKSTTSTEVVTSSVEATGLRGDVTHFIGTIIAVVAFVIIIRWAAKILTPTSE